jgi:hypothetical protein
MIAAILALVVVPVLVIIVGLAWLCLGWSSLSWLLGL